MTSLNVPSNLPISTYLLKQCKLWVWDFDDTLIDSAVYLKQNMSPEAIRARTDAELTHEIPQWRYFRRLIEYLVEHGRYVGIASFGTYEIIQAYLDRIMGFNQKFFTKMNIIAPDFKQHHMGRFTKPANKNEYIYTLMRIYRVQDFKRVVLFDDQASNIADATAIGVIGIQIASPRNGDVEGNMYFGPWIMSQFDAKITRTCGSTDKLYLNRTFTGVDKKESYVGNAFSSNDIDFGTGFETESTLGTYTDLSGLLKARLQGNQPGAIPAFGSGIGDRKINMQPQFRWNTYTGGPNVPRWINGNYENIPGNVETPGYWNPATLGGNTATFWDKYQTTMAIGDIEMGKDGQGVKNIEENIEKNIIAPYKQSGDTSVIGVVEGFETCNATYPKWLMLLFLVIVVLMLVLGVKCC